MNRISIFCSTTYLILGLLALSVIGSAWVKAEDQSEKTSPTFTAERQSERIAAPAEKNSDAIFYAIAITMAFSCLSAGYAVAKVGSAALGAAAEKPELLGRAIIFVGLGEGIAIFGLIISLLLINRL